MAKTCPECQGSKICSSCRGTGISKALTHPMVCPVCRGEGKCLPCGGIGEIGGDAAAWP